MSSTKTTTKASSIKLDILTDKQQDLHKKKLSHQTPLNFHKLSIYNQAQNRAFYINILSSKKVPWLEFSVMDGRLSNKKIVQIFFYGNFDDYPAASCDCDEFYESESGYCLHCAAIQRLFKEEPKLTFGLLDKLPKTLNDYPQEITHFNPVKNKVTTFGKKTLPPYALKTSSMARYEREATLASKNDYSASVGFIERLNAIKERAPYTHDLLNSNIVLFDYQEEVFYKMLAAKRAICSMKVGAGKTATSIACLASLHKSRVHITIEEEKKVSVTTEPRTNCLVIAPNSLLIQWHRELGRMLNNPSIKILKKSTDIENWKNGLENNSITGYDIGIVNYEMCVRYSEFFEQMKNITLLIVDEIQYARNNETKRWEALKKIKSEYMFALSGTVVENKLLDFFSIMQIVDPRRLGPKWKFESEYQDISFLSNTKIMYSGIKNMDKLRDKVSDCMFSYSNVKVPDITYHNKFLFLHKEEQEKTNEYINEAKRLMAKSVNGKLSFAEMAILQSYLLKARQACNTIELLNKKVPQGRKPEKIQLIVELLYDLAVKQNEKVVVFSQWVEMIEIVKRELLQKCNNSLGMVFFTGKQNVKQRDQAVSDFATNPNIKIFFASDAGGVGLDGLQKIACKVVHMELPWNPAILDQRTARVHRMGQQRPVDCYYFIARNSIEFAINDVLQTKREIRNEVMAGTDVDVKNDNNFEAKPKQGVIATILNNTPSEMILPSN